MVDITQSSETTPFSNQPIDKISSTTWSNMSRTQLEDQKYKLQMRLQIAMQMNNPHIVSVIQNGISQLESIISNYKGK